MAGSDGGTATQPAALGLELGVVLCSSISSLPSAPNIVVLLGLDAIPSMQ